MAFFKTEKWLQKHGRRVDALVTSLTQTAGQGYGTMNATLGQNVYVVTAVWTDPQTHTDFTFEKRCLADAGPHTKEGQTLTVYIDPDDPKHYSMNLEC